MRRGGRAWCYECITYPSIRLNLLTSPSVYPAKRAVPSGFQQTVVHIGSLVRLVLPRSSLVRWATTSLVSRFHILMPAEVAGVIGVSESEGRMGDRERGEGGGEKRRGGEEERRRRRRRARERLTCTHPISSRAKIDVVDGGANVVRLQDRAPLQVPKIYFLSVQKTITLATKEEGRREGAW